MRTIGFGFEAEAPPAAPPSKGSAALALALAGGGTGFLLGGPVGAAIGAIIGGVAGARKGASPANPGERVPEMTPAAADSVAAQVQEAARLQAERTGACPDCQASVEEAIRRSATECAKRADAILAAVQAENDELVARNKELQDVLNQVAQQQQAMMAELNYLRSLQGGGSTVKPQATSSMAWQAQQAAPAPAPQEDVPTCPSPYAGPYHGYRNGHAQGAIIDVEGYSEE